MLGSSSDRSTKEARKEERKAQRKAAKERKAAAEDTGQPEIPRNKQELVARIKAKMRLEPEPFWHAAPDAGNRAAKASPFALVGKLQQQAGALLVQETQLSEELHTAESAREEEWTKTILKDGTLGDRLAAWMLRVQESPLHRLRALDTLLGLSAKKSKREALLAVDTLKELWLLNLLPDRKLLRFAQRPLDDLPSDRMARERLLILWHYEAELKARYAAFVTTLTSLTTDQAEQIKTKALGVVFDLLADKPEQEAALLSILCNKLGDPEKKVAAKAGHLLYRLVIKHPNMKLVVTKEVQQVLNRSNLSSQAQYRAVCFMNQLELDRSDSGGELPRLLIDIYFQYFDVVMKKGELESKLLSALLIGVNRAYPFATLEDDVFNSHLDTLFRVVHQGTFSCSVQALMLVFQVIEARQQVGDRFYRALYTKVGFPLVVLLPVTHSASPFSDVSLRVYLHS